MENSSLSSNKSVRSFLSALLAVPIAVVDVWGQAPAHRPFPVLGSITVPEGHWQDVPDLLLRLPDEIKSTSLQYEFIAAAGEQYFSQGLLQESQKAFQRLLKARRPSPPTFMRQMADLRLAEIELLEGNTKASLEHAAALTEDPNPYIAEEAILLQVRCYLLDHQWSEFNRTVRRLLRQNPMYANDLSLNLIQGVAALQQEQLDRALTYFKLYPDEPSALYYQGVCYIHKKELSSALPIYQQMLQKATYGEWIDRMRLALGEAFYWAHDITLAHEFFRPVTRPQAEGALRALALHRQACLYFQQQNFAQCEPILTSLLKEYPDHPLRSQWTYLYASIPIFKKDWKKAIQEQKMALEVERGLAPQIHGVDVSQLKLSAQFRILWAHLMLNDFDGARRLAEAFIQRYPKEPMTSYAYLAKGLASYRMADYDAALEAYQALLNKYPQSSACGKAVYLMTLSLHSARDPFRMAGILNEIHARMQSADTTSVDEWTQNTLYWVADAYQQLNDLSSAEKIYQEFIARAPQSPLVPYALQALGSVLSAQGPARDADAVTAFQQAELRARDLGNRELAEQIVLELGKVYYNQRDFNKAASTWDHLVQISTQTPVRAEALYRMGDALARQDFYQEAIKRWRQLVKSFKGSPLVPEALTRMGTTQAGLGQWAEASVTFNTLKQNFADTPPGKEGAFQLIQCSFNQGNMPLAVGELLSFAQKYPDDPRIPKAADNLLSAFHQKKVTIPPDQQAKLLKLAPGSAGGAALLWERGAALFNDGKYEPAQKLFEKIMLSYPNDEYAPMAYFYNADCYFWLQRWEEAANSYQNFFLSFPKHDRVPNAMFQRAVCLYRKGAYEDSVADFQTFLKKYPEHALSKEAWLNIALAHKKAFQLDQAVAAYRYVAEHYAADPKTNAVWLQMGSLLDVQGKRQEAIQAYARVPETSPEFAESLYRRYLLLEQNHKAAEARQMLETLRGLPQKKNEFRVAALIKLSEQYEQEGLTAAKLRPLYQDLQASSSDAEVIRQASQRLKELESAP